MQMHGNRNLGLWEESVSACDCTARSYTQGYAAQVHRNMYGKHQLFPFTWKSASDRIWTLNDPILLFKKANQNNPIIRKTVLKKAAIQMLTVFLSSAL